MGLSYGLDRGEVLGIPTEIQAQIRSAICRPEGTLEFEYHSVDAFLKNGRPGLLLQIPSGGHLFRLERIEDRQLQFFHSSPGTGTRVATIGLGDLPDFDRAFLAFTWSPREVRFYCGPRIPGVDLLSAIAERSPKQIRLGTDGSVFQIGDIGIESMGVRIRQAGTEVLAPTALEAWNETLEAVNVLWTGKSEAGFLFETTLAAVTLSVLVTGLEAYAKTRFLEIETEGIASDVKEAFYEFASRAERDSNRFEELAAAAAASGTSHLRAFVDTRKINFQNYDHIKRAFRAAYGIKLVEMGVDSDTLAALQKYVRYRHRIVHVSPLLGMLNDDMVPSEEPVFANRALAERAIQCFSEVVAALHRASLDLRPG